MIDRRLEKIITLDIVNKTIDYSNIILYGAGGFGHGAYTILSSNGIIPVAVCDGNSNLHGLDFHGLQIQSISDVANMYPSGKVIIASVEYYEEIKKTVLEYYDLESIISINFFDYEDTTIFRAFFQQNLERFISVYNILADDKSKEVYFNIVKGRYTEDAECLQRVSSPDQYFNDIIKLSNNETFVDGGAFTGDTLNKFVKITKSVFGEVYCFEPETLAFKALKTYHKKYINGDNRVQLYNKGLFDREGILSFCDSIGDGGNKVVGVDDETTKIQVDSIDNIVKSGVTFIKLDIEGSELKALEGAVKTIKKSKPKLAICIYHKNEDLIEIPEYIKSLDMDYKIYIRHHGVSPALIYETVLYAI